MALSVDDVEQSKKLKEKLGIALAPYSDPGGAAAQAWKVWDKETEIALAASFVVMPGGKVAFRYVGANKSDRPKVADYLAAIDKAAP